MTHDSLRYINILTYLLTYLLTTGVVVLVVDHASQGMWAGLNLALSAANLADVSGDTLRKDAVAEVYVLAAMTIRFYFPSQLHFLAVSITHC